MRQLLLVAFALQSLATVTVPRAASSQSATGPSRVLRTTIDLRITGSEKSWLPTTINDIEVDRHGNIYVLDFRQQSIAKFSQSGQFVEFIGKRGEGPGEFKSALRLQLLNDTLWVIEGRQRTSSFSIGNPKTGNSRVVASSGAGQEGLEGTMRAGFLKSSVLGTLGGKFEVFATDRNGQSRAPIVSAVIQPRTFYSSLAPVGSASGGTARTLIVQPFWTGPLWSIARGGDGVVSTTYRETNGAFDTVVVTAASSLGNVRWSRRLTYPASVLNDKEFAAIIDSLSKPRNISGVMMVPDKALIRRTVVRPRHWPPVYQVLAGADSTIWLRVFAPDSTSQKWWVLSPTGVPESTVTLPRGLTLMRASRSMVWSRGVDEDDVPVVVRLRLSN
jgi:hypothetical protein